MGTRARMSVRGVVQGVGFRPFVYRLAREHKLTGWVRNTSGAVEIEVEGDKNAVTSFLKIFEAKAPPRASIETLDTTFYPTKGYTGFEIRDSLSQESEYQLVSPDIATCEDCRREILSPGDRRYRYPFTNCTNCGPRFTIIQGIPYDRAATTMRAFVMCGECQQEYEDPLDRRFHAQPNACPICGPRLELVDSNGTVIACDDPIAATSELLQQGKVVAVKGLGGFHLVCDATSGPAVMRLRERKGRHAKPFAVMMESLEEIEQHCVVSREERELLLSPECPIVLLRWRHRASRISPAVAPNLCYLGAMLPYTPLHHILLRDSGRPLVMTSGNISGEPLAKDNEEALARLGDIADYFLLHDREIHVRCDDSVCMVVDTPQVLRHARGYAPSPISLHFKSKQILACGAELKNTFCFTKERHAFLSQHIGEMDNEGTIEHFADTIALYQHLFRVTPELVACDMHPDYASTKYAHILAKKQGLTLTAVQHHHAHVVACLTDNGVEGPVIGVAFDGTGYGTDETIWGGEFLIADRYKFERVGHLEQVPLPGGEAAIRRPYRMALSYLYTLLGDDVSLDGLSLSKIDPAERDVIRQQSRQRINAPLTSSAGRLFDAVSALIGVRDKIDYDAQAAIELEMVALGRSGERGIYPILLDRANEMQVVRLGSLFAQIVKEIRDKVPAAIIAARFHTTMAQATARVCTAIAGNRGLKRVALTGGVFQNRLLLRLTTAILREEGFTVLTHNRVPCNDGGISVGQAVIANFKHQ